MLVLRNKQIQHKTSRRPESILCLFLIDYFLRSSLNTIRIFYRGGGGVKLFYILRFNTSIHLSNILRCFMVFCILHNEEKIAEHSTMYRGWGVGGWGCCNQESLFPQDLCMFWGIFINFLPIFSNMFLISFYM